MMNVINKLLTFGHVQLVEGITDDTPEHINYLYGFLLWICFPLIGLIPAFFVEEDLRRLNMKDVEKSQYVEEKVLLQKDDAERKRFYRENKIIAADDVLEQFFDIHHRYSMRETHKSESLTTEDYDRKLRNRRNSDDSVRKSTHEPLIKLSGADHQSKRDSRMSRAKKSIAAPLGEESMNSKKLISLNKVKRVKNQDDDDDIDF